MNGCIPHKMAHGLRDEEPRLRREERSNAEGTGFTLLVVSVQAFSAISTVGTSVSSLTMS